MYGLGGMAYQAVSVLLVPIYAHQLGVAHYGTLALLLTTQSLTTMIVGLAMPQAFFRSYLKEAVEEDDRKRVLRTTMALRLAVSGAGFGLFAIAALPLTLLIFGSSTELPILLLVGLIACLDSVNTIPLSLLRAERRARAYAILSFARAGLGMIFILIGLGLGMGISGVLLGSLVAAVLTAGAGLRVVFRTIGLRLNWQRPLVRHMLVFSLPLVPAAVAGWSLSLSDRYIVQGFSGSTAVGIYAGGYTIGLLVTALVVQPFGLTWGAAYWELAREASASRIFARVLTGFTVLTCVIAVALSVFGTDIIRLFLTPAFEDGRFVVPFSAFAYVCYGIYSIVGTGLNLESQTRWVPVTMGIPAVLNVILNLVLVPNVGFMGAAVSTLASYALLALLTGLAAHRYYPVPWEIRRVLLTATLGMTLAEVALFGPDSLLWRAGCFLLYLPLLALARVIRSSDIALLRAVLSRQGWGSAT